MDKGRMPAGAASIMTKLRAAYPLPIILVDFAGWAIGFLIAGRLRNEVSFAALNWWRIFLVAGIAAVLFFFLALVVGLYRDRWRVSTFEEWVAVAVTWMPAAGFAFIFNTLVLNPRVPTSIVGLGAGMALALMAGARTVWRLLRQTLRRPDPQGRKRVVVFGAGEAGNGIITSMLGDPDSQYVPVALLDDDPKRQNRVVSGVRVAGSRDRIELIGDQADVLLIAIPSADAETINELAQAGDAAGLEVMVLPSTTELLGMMATIDQARPLEITDLLGRDEVSIDTEAVAAYIRGARVLVTGAGGSIGSELCRQISLYEPEQLYMVDRDETALQSVQLTISGHGLLDDPGLVLADIRDRDRVFEIFKECKPTVVFHAAALKHLPLLEAHPREGLLTNVFGTKNLLDAAEQFGVERFVNVSTDKAASPTSALGTTKRLAEVLTVETGTRSKKGQFLSVRFGNVLGSRGSVLPAFREQIQNGGPITVTHPDVTRYFMSIPEASRLILQGGVFGKTGETLVLDMGEPMKIVELAERLIRHEKADVDIVFTGLRPNEKLHEVLSSDDELMQDGPHPRIWHTVAANYTDSGLDVEGLKAVPGAELAERLLEVCHTLRPAPETDQSAPAKAHG